MRIATELADGTFAFSESDEDIHTAVERRLTELIGDAGRRLHTARSRNDQVITDTLLHLRAAAEGQVAGLRALAGELLAQAEAHIDTILPGYTHGQRAQPVRLAHHLLAYVWMLDRDRTRLATRSRATADCPLGSGALSGVGFPIDREARPPSSASPGRAPTAWTPWAAATPRRLPALRGAARRAPLAARRRDRALGRRGGRVRRARRRVQLGLLDAPPEEEPRRRRARPGQGPRLIADLSGLLGVMSGLPLAYNKDMQEDKEYLFDAIDTVDLLLPAMAGMVAGARFRADRMAAAASGGFLAATDLADHLVTLGWPFRRAHEAVGRLVRACLDRGVGLEGATAEDVAAAGLRGRRAARPDGRGVGRGQAGTRRHRPRGRRRPDGRRPRAGGGVVSALAARPAPGTRLGRDFFARPVSEVAPDLLGCVLRWTASAA